MVVNTQRPLRRGRCCPADGVPLRPAGLAPVERMVDHYGPDRRVPLRPRRPSCRWSGMVDHYGMRPNIRPTGTRPAGTSWQLWLAAGSGQTFVPPTRGRWGREVERSSALGPTGSRPAGGTYDGRRTENGPAGPQGPLDAPSRQGRMVGAALVAGSGRGAALVPAAADAVIAGPARRPTN